MGAAGAQATGRVMGAAGAQATRLAALTARYRMACSPCGRARSAAPSVRASAITSA